MNQTILIVDDEPAVLATISKALSRDYVVRAANSGARALSAVVKPPVPDLILLDVLMPGMDGYQVLAQLKENPATNDIPVIFVTGMEKSGDEEEGLNRGAVDYITKPIMPAVLLARVKTHLVLKNARDFLLDKNAYLEAEITRRMEENQVVQNVGIRALAHLAETRDPETGDHILRTQAYVKALAQQLKERPAFSQTISNQYVRLLAESAPLHDIGKVGIPDHILLKPGRLTDEERQIMNTHTELGARAIESAEKDVERPVEFLSLAKEIAHWHHERWDGKGYPDGLAGEAIPLSARLMALADVFDALISKRIYKSAISFDKAREIIASERGRQFDPEITDVFLDAFDRFVAIAAIHQSEGESGAGPPGNSI